MNTQKVSDKLIPTLRNCRTRDELRHFFNSNGISDSKTKLAYIRKATNEIAAYYNGGNEIDDDTQYLDDEVLFLKGTWRVFLNGRA